MYMCVHVCVYSACVYVYMYVCVYVCMYIYVRAHVGVHMHSYRRILFICTVQSLYYMRMYHRCFLTLACVCVGGLEVGYGLGGVEIGVLACIFLYFCGC